MSLKIEILPSASKQPVREGWIRLSEKDFNHYESFFAKHPNIKPESADEIYVKGILEVDPHPLIILRHIDWLLKKNGHLVIETYNLHYSKSFYMRPLVLTHLFISLAFKDHLINIRKKQIDFVVQDEYVKVKNSLVSDDSLYKWSFGICSNGQKNDSVCSIIDKIISLDIPNYEIIICGPSPSDKLPNTVRVIDDSPIYIEGELRAPICVKKNMIVQNAKYENIVLMHDRYMFPDNWYTNMCIYGNYFDILQIPATSVFDKRARATDWLYFNIYDKSDKRNQTENFGYDMFSENVYLCGGFCIIKKSIYMQHPQLPYLYWDDTEDLEFFQRLSRLGYLLQIDTTNEIYTTRLIINGRRYGEDHVISRSRKWAHDRYSQRKAYCEYMKIPYKGRFVDGISMWSWRITNRLYKILKRMWL